MSRISIKDIITEEIQTFVNLDDCKHRVHLYDFLENPDQGEYGCKMDTSGIMLYFGLPFVLSALVIWSGLKLFDVNTLLTSMSIFIGLLLNMLLLLYDITRKYQRSNQTDTNPLRDFLLKQIYINISFSITIGILTIILILLAPKLPSSTSNVRVSISSLNIDILCVICTSFKFFIYGLVIMFVLHLLVIVRRVYYLTKEEFEGEKRGDL